MAWATLGAAGISAASAYAVNQANIKNQRKTNDLSVNLANTSHQREVADLRLAGLNPILSAQGSGASTPNLGSATVDNPVASLADTVNSAFSGHSRRKVEQEQVEQIRQATLNNRLTNEQMALETQALRAEADERVSSARNAKLEEDLDFGAKMRYLEGSGNWNPDGSERPHLSADGRRSYKVYSPKNYESTSDLYRGRWISGLKDASNRNWRNNARAIGDTVNSAVDAGVKLTPARHVPKWSYQRGRRPVP